MTFEERTMLEQRVLTTFEQRINAAMKELQKYCVANGFTDEQKAALLGFAGFLEKKLMDVIDDYYE